MSPIVRGALRGVAAAVAMSGTRAVAKRFRLVDATPPEEIAVHGAPTLLARIPAGHRGTAIELAHWSFGGAAGALYSLLPADARRVVWVGPAYGVVIWLAFEAIATPLLGLPSRRRDLSERFAIAADHVLYGVILSA